MVFSISGAKWDREFEGEGQRKNGHIFIDTFLYQF